MWRHNKRKFKKNKFKSLSCRATSILKNIRSIGSIIGAARPTKHCTKGDSIITKTAEQKELEFINKKFGCPDGTQTHVHEFLGSTKLAEEGDDRHNHRFAGVTSQKIPQSCGGHKHALLTNTDFFENHHHEIGVITGLAIPVGNGKHVHFVDGNTTLDDGHFHLFQFTTLIESPLT
ncbi:MAG TPA: hypothetical protein DD730_01765 [Desulfosporosinus sp.]|jgi:hypothetical protein|nr:hypothetical protein [Desulfosporosinus sp.]